MQDTLIDGRYLLLAPIGSGGEARVYRARNTVSGNEVAVRLALKPATLAAPCTLPVFHPNWVKFLHWGIDPQRGAYQIFELLEGATLDVLIKSEPLNPDAWRDFVVQSLDAVAALHETGWIHGDLNAGNFFKAAKNWKLLELPFLHFDPPLNRSAVFGSIHTLAPEQIDGTQADVRSDLYSLGCLYYYAASGEYPHSGTNVQEVAISCLRFEPIPLREKTPDLPVAWSDAVMSLLVRNPQSRVQTVGAARGLLGIA